MPSDLPPIRKFERTRHLTGSQIQSGDEDLETVSLEELLRVGDLVVEEKLDGANSGFRFDHGGNLLAQSRGHYLDMGNIHSPRERDFTLLKVWLRSVEDDFLDRFEDRYVVYGEWMAICHTVYYDRLPHYFMEFDTFDLQTGKMLSTMARRELHAGLPIVSVPTIPAQHVRKIDDLRGLVQNSFFKTPMAFGDWIENLRQSCALVGDNFDERLGKLDRSMLSEGLYLKAERDGEVVMRAKWVRPDFIQTIQVADEHWQSRFPVPNLLDARLDAFPAHLAVEPLYTVEYDPDRAEEWIGH